MIFNYQKVNLDLIKLINKNLKKIRNERKIIRIQKYGSSDYTLLRGNYFETKFVFINIIYCI